MRAWTVLYDVDTNGQVSTLHPLRPGILRLLPEVIDLTVGMGHNSGVVFDVEVVPEDGGDEAGKARVSGKGCEVKGVLAIAVGVVEADAFR